MHQYNESEIMKAEIIMKEMKISALKAENDSA
jgi:hypothetical protein